MATKYRWSMRETTGERGATAVEYSALIALIAAVIVFAVSAVGIDVGGLWASANW